MNCSACDKEVTEDQIKDYNDMPVCKDCYVNMRKDDKKLYYKTHNEDKKKAAKAKYRDRNKDKLAAYNRDYYAKHKVKGYQQILRGYRKGIPRTLAIHYTRKTRLQ